MGHPSYLEILVILVLGGVLAGVSYQWWRRIDDRPSDAWQAWLTRAVVFVVALGIIALVIHTLFSPSVCGEYCDRQY